MDWLPWAPLGAVILHIFEEFVYPGGFVAWYRRYRFDASRITARFLVVINAALLIACWDIAILERRGTGVPYWLTIAALTCSNGCWHAWASFKSREYSGCLRLRPFSAVRRSFDDDRVGRSHCRWFVSLLVCTFSQRVAAIALAPNGFK
jgi:hypothetical protein